MKKTIQEIQKENRKFILEAIHGCSYEEIVQKDYIDAFQYALNVESDKKEIIDIAGKPITLSHLLLALPNGQNGEQIEIQLSWFGDSLIIKYHFFAPRKIFWKLIKTTLEEQNEETQKELNKLLNGVKICQQ